jgi:hypothetical protein
MDRHITGSHAPAMGDVRVMGTGDTVWLHEGATGRPDWPRMVDAIGAAISRGAEVRRA